MNGPTIEIITEVTQVLYHEASLLDDGCYEDWLALLHDSVTYLAPIREDLAELREDPHELKFFQEDLESLRLRVAKIRTGLSQTENPRSRVVRLISNVLVTNESGSGEYPVRSAFLAYRQHRQRQVELLAGHRRDRWKREPEGWRLVHREVLFAANVLPVKSLPLFY